MKHEFTVIVDDETSTPEEVLVELTKAINKIYEQKDFEIELMESEDASDEEESDGVDIASDDEESELE